MLSGKLYEILAFSNDYFFTDLRPELGGRIGYSSVISLSSIARGIAFRNCCKRQCLWKPGTTMERAEHIVLSCMEEVRNLSKREKKEYIQ